MNAEEKATYLRAKRERAHARKDARATAERTADQAHARAELATAVADFNARERARTGPVVTPGTYNEYADVPDGMPPRAGPTGVNQDQAIADFTTNFNPSRSMGNTWRIAATQSEAERVALSAERMLGPTGNVTVYVPSLGRNTQITIPQLPIFISNELIENAKAQNKTWECIICCEDKCPSAYKFRICGHKQCGDCFTKCGKKCPECRA